MEKWGREGRAGKGRKEPPNKSGYGLARSVVTFIDTEHAGKQTEQRRKHNHIGEPKINMIIVI